MTDQEIIDAIMNAPDRELTNETLENIGGVDYVNTNTFHSATVHSDKSVLVTFLNTPSGCLGSEKSLI